eukprot:494030_1
MMMFQSFQKIFINWSAIISSMDSVMNRCMLLKREDVLTLMKHVHNLNISLSVVMIHMHMVMMVMMNRNPAIVKWIVKTIVKKSAEYYRFVMVNAKHHAFKTRFAAFYTAKKEHNGRSEYNAETTKRRATVIKKYGSIDEYKNKKKNKWKCPDCANVQKTRKTYLEKHLTDYHGGAAQVWCVYCKHQCCDFNQWKLHLTRAKHKGNVKTSKWRSVLKRYVD